MLQYLLLRATNPKDLNTLVNDCIAAGWGLYYGPFSDASGSSCQAVTREETTPDRPPVDTATEETE